MDNPWAVVAFVGIFVVVFGARWLAGRLGGKVHQAINRDDYSTGNGLYNGTWEWATAAPWDVVRQAALRELSALQTQTPALKIAADSPAQEHLDFAFDIGAAPASDRVARFGFDTSHPEFTARLNFLGGGQGKRVAHFEFLSMRTLDKVARAVPEMRQLLAMVERAIKAADPLARDLTNSSSR
jgi:hypothetical protein